MQKHNIKSLIDKLWTFSKSKTKTIEQISALLHFRTPVPPPPSLLLMNNHKEMPLNANRSPA